MSVCLSVRHTLVSKRLNLSSNCLHCLVAPCAKMANFWTYGLNYWETVEDRWIHATMCLTSIYRDCPGPLAYPGEAKMCIRLIAETMTHVPLAIAILLVELCYRQTNRQTNKRSQTSYPRRPTLGNDCKNVRNCLQQLASGYVSCFPIPSWWTHLLWSYTSVYMEQLHLIWQKCAFLSLPALIVVFSVLRHLTTPLMVHWAKTTTYGQRSFSVSGPSVWNDLPPTLRASSTTLGQFQNKLKTVLFCSAYETW